MEFLSAKKPNTKLSIKDYHFNALKVLDDMYDEHRAILRKRNYCVDNARVRREDWKTRLMTELRCNYYLACEIERSLLSDGVLVLGGTHKYVERAV